MKPLLKFNIAFFLNFLLCIAANSQTMTLKGNIKGLPNDSVQIIRFTDEVELTYIPVTNESFVYTHPTSNPTFIQVFSHWRKLADVFLVPGITYMTGTAPRFDSVKISGSRPDSIMRSYLDEDEILLTKAWALRESFDSLRDFRRYLEANQVMWELRMVARYERIQLLKKYVSDNRSEIVGALLPNFCILQDELSKFDFLQMYQMLSPEIQQSTYGQSVLQRTQPKKKKQE